MHVDPMYQPTASPMDGCFCRASCSNTSLLWSGHAVRPFGQAECAAPNGLFEHMLASAARREPSPDFVFLLGDAIAQAHGDDSTDEDEPPPAVRLPSPPSAAVLAPPVQPSPVVGLAASRTASGADWQVLLGGSFKSYDDTVQAVIESAWAADEEEVEVQVRVSAYVILLRETPMIQQVKGDTSRWRKVRRAPK